jgi:hypothetical protein
MRWPLVSRRYHERELEYVKADRERLRGERDQFAKDRDTQQAVARSATRQFTDADEELIATRIVNDCLTRDLAEVRKQLAERDTDGWQAQFEQERKRADRLQRRLDDAVGLKSGGIEDSSQWQPALRDKKGAVS